MRRGNEKIIDRTSGLVCDFSLKTVEVSDTYSLYIEIISWADLMASLSLVILNMSIHSIICICPPSPFHIMPPSLELIPSFFKTNTKSSKKSTRQDLHTPLSSSPSPSHPTPGSPDS
ncbi:hypothetical protein OCU04_004220 [Sclerotinia nivalis]|uniref:Uncharacterized protein n=1 Tax=Sclerotinia nivalis TaxID=352851 RepID=A0A9X0DDP9_9HELO|nr:hypothetical protein OCU04_013268 [Sclerotinia nivalis]KAJ8066838.1 hypothetical protein OCU04_004220 [Sclerotinia nivalis]